MPAERKAGTRPMKSERTHEENQERAYIAASRRSDRSLEARVESARRASEIHKKRTGKALRITEKDVMNEEMYEEEDDEIPRISYRNAMGMYPNLPAEARLHGFLSYQMMVQQALGQYGDKGFQNYHFTNPDLYNPYSFDASMYTPMHYSNMHQQQYATMQHQAAKTPVNAPLMNRFHPYTKLNYVQKRPYATIQSPAKYQPTPQITYQTHPAISPSPQKISPQKTRSLSPAMSQASNQSSQRQPQTPTLTNSEGNTPAHSGLPASSPLATSPIVPQSQPSGDVYNVNPLSTRFSADVATFLKHPCMNDALNSNYNLLDDLGSTKSVETVSTTPPAVDQSQISFSDLFDSSLFRSTLPNVKNSDLQQTTVDGSLYTDMNFDTDTLFGLGPSLNSQTSAAYSLNDQSLDQLKADPAGSTDFSELWSFEDSTWQLGTEFGALES